jgi:hypothetical protein
LEDRAQWVQGHTSLVSSPRPGFTPQQSDRDTVEAFPRELRVEGRGPDTKQEGRAWRSHGGQCPGDTAGRLSLAPWPSPAGRGGGLIHPGPAQEETERVEQAGPAQPRQPPGREGIS